ncbi:MAG: hypothetical protein FVQ83_13745 [Chloroflexi bacterium]|nr:hypothetical protein [Chloroflexota bacterium]
MKDQNYISSIEEWLELVELQLPNLRDPDEKGTIYNVKKVGFLAVPVKDCAGRIMKTRKIPGNKCLLPTIVLNIESKDELYRLPVELSEWVENCVAMAHSGMSPFPSEVEFGILDGRSYAELLL